MLIKIYIKCFRQKKQGLHNSFLAFYKALLTIVQCLPLDQHGPISARDTISICD